MNYFNGDFEKDHPERLEDEVFLGNIDKGIYLVCGHKTKRLGDIAYSVKGQPLDLTEQRFPMFIKKWEYDEIQRNPSFNF